LSRFGTKDKVITSSILLRLIMLTFISRMLSLLLPSVVLSVLIGARSALAVYHYKQEWVGSVYLFTFKVFAVAIAFFAIIIYLCSRKSSLVKAIEDKKISLLESIISRKPHLVNQMINPFNYLETTPLIYAIEIKNCSSITFAAAKILIKYGADVNLTDKRGYSPLFLAAKEGDERLVQLLLEKGANASYIFPRYGRESGKTPLDAARNERHGKIVELLLNHQGAKR
jgi:hypothetical protein